MNSGGLFSLAIRFSRRDFIPSKPKTGNSNLQSHSGIFNTAAAVLDFLFRSFPNSAKQLKKDRGLYSGPRPCVCHKVNIKQLATVLKGNLQGAVVLAHDKSISHLGRALSYPLVYGIREAKGSEFKSVVLFNFFSELPSSLQKAWRDLLLSRS